MDLLAVFKIALFLCFGVFLYADLVEFEKLILKPKSLAKDYYIYRLLTEGNATKEQAKALYPQIRIKSSKILKAIHKLYIPSPKAEDRCKYLSKKNFLLDKADCQAIRLNPNFVLTLNSKEKKQILKNMQPKYKQIAHYIEVLSNKNKSYAISKTDAKTYMQIYKSFSTKTKAKYFNHNLSANLLKTLSNEPYFEQYIKNILFAKSYNKTKKSLLKINHSTKNPASNFYLALNAIKLKNEKIAIKFLEAAHKYSDIRYDKDRALLWLYLLKNDKQYLVKLANSFELNFYSVYAREKLNLAPIKVFTPKPNIEKFDNFKANDPFYWDDVKNAISDLNASQKKEYAKMFFTKQTLPHYAYIMELASNFKDSYFIMPYNKYLSNKSLERQVMIYSISKQESRYIPTAISTSYALGLMQFMPFLAKHIAKELKVESFDLDFMFRPDVSLKFANFHLDYLEKYLKHPLFISYAYNGGIGFTRRLLQSKLYFRNAKFEPFLSMELIPYAESREYGKKVLVNYVTYANLLDLNISLINLVEKLKTPQKYYQF